MEVKPRYMGNLQPIEEKIKTDFLILGHPRSGTGYISKLFSGYGIKIGHECIDDHGISCWTFATKSANHFYGVPKNESQKKIKGISRQDLNYNHLIQNVRNPFDTINSVYHTESISNSHIFRMLHCQPIIDENLDMLSKTILSTVRWNKMIESLSPDIVFKVEDCESEVKEYLNSLNFNMIDNVFDNKKYNSREKSSIYKLTPEDYSSVPTYVLNELDEYCMKYNYKNILND
jgi:hypothetical protein